MHPCPVPRAWAKGHLLRYRATGTRPGTGGIRPQQVESRPACLLLHPGPRMLQRDPPSIRPGLVASSDLVGDHVHSTVRRKTGFKPYGMRRWGGLIRSTEVVTRRPQQQCSIALWRGFVRAQFYAREQGDDRALRVSPFFPIWHFPWEHSLPLEVDPRARAALADLRDDLVADGWEPMPRAARTAWYELRFQRDDTAELGYAYQQHA